MLALPGSLVKIRLVDRLMNLRRGGAFLAAGFLMTLVARPAITLGAVSVDPTDSLALAPAPFNHTHEWLIYVALGLGALNTILLYLLNRSARPAVADAAAARSEAGTSDGLHGSSSSRTDKRMDKRKREIDDLRQQVEDLTGQLTAETTKRLTPAQIQELVRALVHDELTRSSLPGSSPSR